jgi:hypothetical protein
MSEEGENFDELFVSVFEFFSEEPRIASKLRALRERIRTLEKENARLRRMLNPPQPAASARVDDPWAVPVERPPIAPPPRDAWEPHEPPAPRGARFACRICSELKNEDELVKDDRGFRCAT